MTIFESTLVLSLTVQSIRMLFRQVYMLDANLENTIAY